METDDDLTSKIIGGAMYVHTKLGPGLLESTYQECLYFVLARQGLLVEKQVPLPLIFDDVKLECGYRIDLLIEKRIIIEIKSVEALAPIHTSQVLTYLKLSNNRIGLLMNFNVMRLKEGLRRIVNG